MRFQISSLLFFGLFRFSTQFEDIGFENYCNRTNGEITKHQSVDGQPASGETCKFTLDLPTENDDEVKEHCSHWAIHPLRSWKMKNETAECVVENIYKCRDDFEQIRGKCYKVMSEGWVTYERAKDICQSQNSEILKLENIHFGEILESQFNNLTMYYVQPDEQLQNWTTFSGGEGPNYVVFFNNASIFDGTGSNEIMRIKKEQFADVMCMHQSEPTALSIAENLKKLAPYYHPIVSAGVSSVWRTSGMYTKTNLPDHDVCAASMKAVIGSNEGSLMNLDPKYTNILSTELRNSVVQVFAPITDCAPLNQTAPSTVFYTHEPANETEYGPNCTSNYADIPDQEYNANFHRSEVRDHPWSYMYYPSKAGNYTFDTSRFATHGPMLCGMLKTYDEHRVPRCPQDGRRWYRVQRSPGQYVCHTLFWGRFIYWEGSEYCKNENWQLTRWGSVEEFNLVWNIVKNEICEIHCRVWVWCIHTIGCTKHSWREWTASAVDTWHMDYPVISSAGLSWRQKTHLEGFMCETPAV